MMSDMAPELAETLTGMIAMDDPRHQRLRGTVSRAFTPKVLSHIEESIRERSRRLVSTMVSNHPNGNGELIAEIAGPLSLQVICDMMGIPESDYQQILDWTNVIAGFGDADVTVEFDDFARATHGIGDYGIALAEDRRINPHDDLTTSLVQAEVDGEQLTSGEIAADKAEVAVRLADFDPATGEFPVANVEAQLSPRTRLVAIAAASNLIGTMPDIKAIAAVTHAAGALLYVDGVHYMAHYPVVPADERTYAWESRVVRMGKRPPRSRCRTSTWVRSSSGALRTTSGTEPSRRCAAKRRSPSSRNMPRPVCP
jgi:hypothetical protein